MLWAVERQSAEHFAAELSRRLEYGLDLTRREIAYSLYGCASKRESLLLAAWLLERLKERPEAFRTRHRSQQAVLSHLLAAIRGVGPRTAAELLEECGLDRRLPLPELSAAQVEALREALLARAPAP